MAITNAEMAEAWGDLLELTPEQITQLTGLLDQWALGGARLATLARLTTDVSTFNDAAIRMVHDWYGGEATGGPNGDGLYPLMNSDAEVFLVPSPAKIMAGVSALDPKGVLADVSDLPPVGAAGDLWVVSGVSYVWSMSAVAWVGMGPWQGPQGVGGTIADVTVTMGAPGSAPEVELGGTPQAREIGLRIPAAADGVTPNVSFEIVMVAHGEAATVVQSGTVEAPHLIFNIPSPLPGVDGKNIEIQKSATHVQWRRVGDAVWTDLIALTDLMVKGDKGDAFEFDAKPADMAARAAYDAEAEGFTVLVMDTGYVYARIGTTPGVWSDGFPFGQTQNAILEALSALNATEGVLVQTGAATFAKRAIGAGADDDLLNRGAADVRYHQKGDPVALADVTGLAAALDDKANAAAVIALLAQKADKADTYTKAQVDALIPALATKEEVWAGTVANKVVSPSVMKAAMEFQALAPVANVVTMNGHAGINFTVPQLTANATLANPTNKVDGRDGKINFSCDASARTLSVGSDWKKFAASPAIPTAANSKFTIVYSIIGTDVFYSVLVKP